jgi:hypothetical protein
MMTNEVGVSVTIRGIPSFMPNSNPNTNPNPNFNIF